MLRPGEAQVRRGGGRDAVAEGMWEPESRRVCHDPCARHAAADQACMCPHMCLVL